MGFFRQRPSEYLRIASPHEKRYRSICQNISWSKNDVTWKRFSQVAFQAKQAREAICCVPSVEPALQACGGNGAPCWRQLLAREPQVSPRWSRRIILWLGPCNCPRALGSGSEGSTCHRVTWRHAIRLFCCAAERSPHATILTSAQFAQICAV